MNFLCSWRLQDCSGSRCLAAVIYGVAIAIDVYKYFKGKLALLNPALQDMIRKILSTFLTAECNK